MPTKRNAVLLIFTFSCLVFLLFLGYYLYAGILLAIAGTGFVLKKLNPATPTPAPTPGTAPATKKPWPRWIKWLLWIFVWIPLFLFFLLLGYRKWDLTKELGRDATGFLENEVVIEAILTDFQEKTLPAPVPKAGYYRVSIYASPEYSYVCPGAGGVTPGYTTGGDGFGNIQVQGSKNGSPVGNGETVLIDEEKITLSFRFPAIQWDAIQDCKAIIIGGLKIKLYLKGI